MNIVDPGIEEYLNKTLTVSSPILREMQRFGDSKEFPIVGPQVGRLLLILARTIGATRVLELGSGFGYSAMWFAEAVGSGGRVVLTEGSKENAMQAEDYLRRAGLLSRVQIEVGDALHVAARLPGMFDIVFSDIDKKDYPRTLDIVRPKLRSGGLFITDNVLWGGAVLGAARTADVRGIKEFTRLLLASPDFVTTILPVRDGIAIALRV